MVDSAADQRLGAQPPLGDVSESGARLHVGAPLDEATLLVLVADNWQGDVLIDGRSVAARSVERYGFRFQAVTQTLDAGEHQVRWDGAV